MKHVSIIGIIFTVGLLIFLKVFQDSIPRVNEPITNTFVFIGVIILAITIIYIKSKKNEHRSE